MSNPAAHLQRTFELFKADNAIVEVRALDCSGKSKAWDGWATGTVSGYFDDADAFIAAVTALDREKNASGIYITLNGVLPDLLARAANRLIAISKHGTTTDDTHILARRWLLLDFDPKRASGISSTQQELKAALDAANCAAESLASLGWPAPVKACSGNGIHLLYRVDLPNDESAKKLLHTVLKSLNATYSTATVDLDTSVFNPARISKLYGTWARKGDVIDERPHRRSQFLEIDTIPPLDIVPLHLLESMAAQFVPSPSKPAPARRLDAPSHSQVEEALRCLPAHFGSNSYNIWLEVLMAVHSVFSGSDGVALCERYIPGKPGEIERKFAGFDGGGGVGVGTLFHIAEGYGYQPSRSNAPYSVKPPETLPELSNDEIHALIVGSKLPEIIVERRQLSAVRDDFKASLQRLNALNPARPRIGTRGGLLIHMPLDGDEIKLMNLGGLTNIAADSARWIVIRKNQDGEPAPVDVFPPKDVISTYMGARSWPELPALEGVVFCPVYTDNGWITTPGYDPKSGILLAVDMPLGNTVPTPDRVAWALDLIQKELLGEFPFKDDASRAHAIALVLLGFLRHIIDGPTPMHLTEAPEKGTGKGLLVSACCLPALGQEVPSMPSPHEEDEWRKQITAALQKGSSHTNYDNATRLDSAALAIALTQERWEDRQLSSTHILSFRVRTIWTATANNTQLSDEIARRCIRIRLDANMERPFERTGFRHANLLGWAKEHRAELATAAMILINNWVEKGKPMGSYVKGSFQAWAMTMGGILDAAGIPGFLANERELFEAAVNDANLWTSFIEAWREKHRDQWVTTKDLFKLASHLDNPTPGEADYLGLLDDLLGAGNDRSRQIRLGNRLAHMTDRVISGWKIVRGSVVKGLQQWRLKFTPSDSNIGHSQVPRGDVGRMSETTSYPVSPEVEGPGVDQVGSFPANSPNGNIDQDRENNLHALLTDNLTSYTSYTSHLHTGKNGVDVQNDILPSDQHPTLQGKNMAAPAVGVDVEDLGL